MNSYDNNNNISSTRAVCNLIKFLAKASRGAYVSAQRN